MLFYKNKSLEKKNHVLKIKPTFKKNSDVKLNKTIITHEGGKKSPNASNGTTLERHDPFIYSHTKYLLYLGFEGPHREGFYLYAYIKNERKKKENDGCVIK